MSINNIQKILQDYKYSNVPLEKTTSSIFKHYLQTFITQRDYENVIDFLLDYKFSRSNLKSCIKSLEEYCNTRYNLSLEDSKTVLPQIKLNKLIQKTSQPSANKFAPSQIPTADFEMDTIIFRLKTLGILSSTVNFKLKYTGSYGNKYIYSLVSPDIYGNIPQFNQAQVGYSIDYDACIGNSPLEYAVNTLYKYLIDTIECYKKQQTSQYIFAWADTDFNYIDNSATSVGIFGVSLCPYTIYHFSVRKQTP